MPLTPRNPPPPPDTPSPVLVPPEPRVLRISRTPTFSPGRPQCFRRPGIPRTHHTPPRSPCTMFTSIKLPTFPQPSCVPSPHSPLLTPCRMQPHPRPELPSPAPSTAMPLIGLSVTRCILQRRRQKRCSSRPHLAPYSYFLVSPQTSWDGSGPSIFASRRLSPGCAHLPQPATTFQRKKARPRGWGSSHLGSFPSIPSYKRPWEMVVFFQKGRWDFTSLRGPALSAWLLGAQIPEILGYLLACILTF